MPGRRRSRRSLAAALLALPLAGVPVAAPAAAAVTASEDVTTVDARAYGPHTLLAERDAAGVAAKQRAVRATPRQSRGVVLIDTVLDYGLGRAAGTGLVIAHDGIVVTNHHVVQGATSIRVTVPSTGKRYVATLVGYDAADDVAVLRLTGAHRLPTVTTHRAVHPGEPVEAVGNARGLDRLTAAEGRVLKNGVTINVRTDFGGHEHLVGLIKNSADVVPGDSGGALLDPADRVVGMSVAASVGTRNVVAFAIPIAHVTRIAARILAGRPGPTIVIGQRGGLGVVIEKTARPGLIAHVVPGSPAARAGIVAGDVITAIDATPVTSNAQLMTLTAGKRVGQQVTVDYTDGTGASHTATIALWAGPVG